LADDKRSGTMIVVVVAVIGLLSTLGASALGGYWASRNVERQFESQRAAAVEDLRRDAYVDFLRASTRACVAQKNGDEKVIDASSQEVIDQGALVIFVSDDQLDDAATRIIEGVLFEGICSSDLEEYLARWNEFVMTAQTRFSAPQGR
jgi:type II secretory pathway pseudopilin PulG